MSAIEESRGAGSFGPSHGDPGLHPHTCLQTGGALHFEGVRKVFHTRAGDVVALDGLTLHVPGGAIQAIAGASGAGKSTLFRCAATLERPDAGRVMLDGVDLSGLRGRALIAARRRIGTVFQTLNLLSSRTAAGNIALPLELEGRERGAIRARVAELLGWVGLGDRGGSYPSALSGGQRQRVAIARALAAAPSLLLCDEPTSALDPETAAVALELIQRARDELGVTVVIITHQLDVVRRVADRVAVIDAGRVVSEDVVVRAVAS